MKYIGKAEQAANAILEAFKAGTIPEALKTIFINRKDNVPCREWSWGNQILAAIFGMGDARGFRQWEEVGRHVKKGGKAFYILAPVMKKIEKTDDAGNKREALIPVAFKGTPVFGIDQTDGEPLKRDEETANFLDTLPLIDVARKWGLSVEAFNGAEKRYLGYYKRGAGIAVGVKNLQTWAHELMHAADDRLGNLKERGQALKSETVAEFGAVVLLEMLGMTEQADRGFCWKYVSAYALRNEKEPIAACMEVLKRTCEAINLIMTEAEALKPIAQEVAA